MGKPRFGNRLRQGRQNTGGTAQIARLPSYGECKESVGFRTDFGNGLLRRKNLRNKKAS